MNVFAVLAAVAVASASAQTKPVCDTGKLAPLLTDPNLAACQAESGLQVPPVGDIPQDVLTKSCKSTACKAMLTKVMSLNTGDCAIGSFSIMDNLVNPIKKVCPEVLGASTESTSTGSGGAGSNTNEEAEVTTAPVEKKPENSASSGAPKEETSASTKPTVPAPAPTTKASSAPAVAVTTGAAVVAAVASLW